MKNLKISIILLLIFIGFVLNIERVDIGSEKDIVDIQSFHYVLLGIIILSTLVFPSVRRIPVTYVLFGWLIIYFILKVLILKDRPLISGIFFYLTVTEIAFLALGVLLSYRLADDLSDFENLLANLNLTGVSNRVMEFENASDSIANEFIRSRRYQIPLSVLLVQLDKDSISLNAEKTMNGLFSEMMARYTQNSLVRLLDKELRRTDYIIEQPNRNRLILLFPETDSEGTKTMVSRIKNLSKDILGIGVSCGYASFPDEAITFDELVKRAEDHFKTQLVNLADIVADEIEKVSVTRN